MADILPKPFTKEGLLQLLEKHLSHLKKHPLEHPLIKDEDPTSSIYSHHLSSLQSPSKPLTPTSATWTTTNSSPQQPSVPSQIAAAGDDAGHYGMYGQAGTVVNPNGLAYVPSVVGQRRPLDMGEDLGGGKRQQQMYPQQGMGMRTR